MKPQHEANLLKLAQLLDTLKPEEFNFKEQVTESCDTSTGICGTCCCAWGWLPRLFPDVAQWDVSGLGTIFVAAIDHEAENGRDLIYTHTVTLGKKLFGLDMSLRNQSKVEWLQVFQPDEESPWAKGGKAPGEDATAAEVAAHIRRFIAYKKGLL